MPNLRRAGKNSGPISSHLWTKVHVVLRCCRRSVPVANALAWLSISVSFRRYRPLKLPLSCEKRRIFGGWVRAPVLFLAVSGPKFTKFRDDIGNPSWFPTPFPDCLYHVPRRRHWSSNLPLSCEVVENGSAVFGSQIFGGEGPKNFNGSLLLWLYLNVWQSLVEAKPGNEEKRRIFGGWVKNSGLILIHLWTKVHIILRHVGNPLYCSLSLQRTCPIVYVIRR